MGGGYITRLTKLIIKPFTQSVELAAADDCSCNQFIKMLHVEPCKKRTQKKAKYTDRWCHLKKTSQKPKLNHCCYQQLNYCTVACRSSQLTYKEPNLAAGPPPRSSAVSDS